MIRQLDSQGWPFNDSYLEAENILAQPSFMMAGRVCSEQYHAFFSTCDSMDVEQPVSLL